MTPEHEFQLDGLRVFRQTGWATRFPGLVQGITARARDLDFVPPGSPAAADPSTEDGWDRLRRASRLGRVARCRQLHGREVVRLDAPLPKGVHVVGEADAMVTGRDDVLLAVSVADCVPVFLVDPERRLLGLVHAGWRGIAAGVVEATLAAMRELNAGSLHVHLGPAICRDCYQVGPEVLEALGLAPAAGRTVDLRGHIARAAVSAGVDRQSLTVSTGCTRCDAGDFYSYRRGDRGQRMCAFLGWPAG